MSSILNQFSELEKMANNILAKRNLQSRENIKNNKKIEVAKTVKKYEKIKKTALESQIFCNDGPFLVVVLLELNTFYSISRKMDMAMMISLDSLPREVTQGLLDAIKRKRADAKNKTKITITETFLKFIYEKKLNNVLTVFNLQTDLEIDGKIFEIIEAHNLKR